MGKKNPKVKDGIRLSVPKSYSKAMDCWFWTCPRCEQKIRHEMSISLTEYNIKGERVCKECFDAYNIESIPRCHKKLLNLRKEAHELGVIFEPICSENLLGFDEKSNDYVETALRYLELVIRESIYLKGKIENAKVGRT